MSKTMEINGMTFEVVRPRKNKLTSMDVQRHLEHVDGRTIWDCYNKPSSWKEDIYEAWWQWYTETQGLYSFGVASYNCMQFTLEMLYQPVHGSETYLLRITRDTNKAILIEG